MRQNQEGMKFMFLPLMAVVLTTLLGLQGLFSFWVLVGVGLVAASPVLHSFSSGFEDKTIAELWEGFITSVTLVAFFSVSMVLYGVYNIAVLAYVVWLIAAMPLVGVCWKCVVGNFKGK